MHEIFTLDNPYTIVFKKSDTNELYTLIFDDTTGTVKFKTDNAMYGTVESSYFDNSNILTTLRDTLNLDENTVLTVEFLLFLDKLTELYKLGGDSATSFLREVLYLENQVLSYNLIHAFCTVYGYYTEAIVELLGETLHFTSVDVPYVNWLVDTKSVLRTPLEFHIELGNGMYNVIQNNKSTVTRVLCTNKPNTEPINFFDKLCKLTYIDGGSVYNLCKTLYKQLLPISLATILANIVSNNNLDKTKKEILTNQIERFTDLMVKLKFENNKF